MNTPYPGLPEGGIRIVYVRPVPVTDLPEEVRSQLPGVDVLYSVNAPDGQRLALVSDRAAAFHLARAHDLAPVSVH